MNKLSYDAKVQNVRLKNVNDISDLYKYRINQHTFMQVTVEDDGVF